VNMVGHQTICPYINAVMSAPFGHQFNIGVIIRIREEGLLTPVSPLSNVMRESGGDCSCYSCHLFFIGAFEGGKN